MLKKRNQKEPQLIYDVPFMKLGYKSKEIDLLVKKTTILVE